MNLSPKIIYHAKAETKKKLMSVRVKKEKKRKRKVDRQCEKVGEFNHAFPV